MMGVLQVVRESNFRNSADVPKIVPLAICVLGGQQSKMIFEASQASLSKVISKLRLFHPFYCSAGDPMMNLGISIGYKIKQCKYSSFLLLLFHHGAQLNQMNFGAFLTDVLRGVRERELPLLNRKFIACKHLKPKDFKNMGAVM